MTLRAKTTEDKPEIGMMLVGPLTDGGRSKVFMVKTLSRLKSGDIKCWLLTYEDGISTEAQVRFPGGVIAAPFRRIDLNNSTAMLTRVAQALSEATLSRAATDGGLPVEFKIPPEKAQELALKVMRAAFRADG